MFVEVYIQKGQIVPEKKRKNSNMWYETTFDKYCTCQPLSSYLQIINKATQGIYIRITSYKLSSVSSILKCYIKRFTFTLKY